jgi:hypothetical protein
MSPQARMAALAPTSRAPVLSRSCAMHISRGGWARYSLPSLPYVPVEQEERNEP